MAAAAAAPADLSMGSLISVISISEIRYEGFLFDINLHSIGLRNVKIFGTEGRLKYGPQIPGGNRIYDYIFLRGSNIKDLQVISSPSPQTTSAAPDDPAIIRPRFPTAMDLTYHGAAQVANVSNIAQPTLPITSFLFNQPRDPSASSSSFWGSFLPPPPANISRLAVPNYWPGFGGSSGGVSYFQHQFPPPPPCLVALQAPVQQQAQHQNVNTSVVGGFRFSEHHHPLLVGRNTGPEVTFSLPEVEQSGPRQSSPSQSLQTSTIDAKTAIAPVKETLQSNSSEETPESPLKPTTETGSTSSPHEKGQSSGGTDQNPGAIRRFQEDFDFEGMNAKFNKKEVWNFFSKQNKAKTDDGNDGDAREVKPVYHKDEFFDSLSYGLSDHESILTPSEQMRIDNETFGLDIPILHQDHGNKPHSAGTLTSRGGRGHGNVRGSRRGTAKQVWRRISK